MHDVQTILSAYDALCGRGAVGVLASVLHVEGSTYRRPGARALIDERGGAEGLVSGGCLEGDLAERAVAVRERGVPARVRYDSTDDADLLFGLGLGCRGVVEVLLECVDAERPGPLTFLRRCFEARRPGVLVTELSAPGFERWTLGPGPDEHASLEGPAVDPERRGALEALARSALHRRAARSEPGRAGRPARFAEYVPPRRRLLVLGAGPDAPALVALASGLGWQVHVWDARAAFARPERLPGADVVVCREAGAGDPDGVVDADTAVVVMSHHFERDKAALAWLLDSPAAYVGALGPLERTREMLADLGRAPSDALHAPAGLDVGAETAGEIALAIAAEIQARSAGHPGGPLRDRKGPIHERPDP